jgi:hypothetical protein
MSHEAFSHENNITTNFKLGGVMAKDIIEVLAENIATKQVSLNLDSQSSALTEIRRLRSQNARLRERLNAAGLLGDPIEALNGDEQRGMQR